MSRKMMVVAMALVAGLVFGLGGGAWADVLDHFNNGILADGWTERESPAGTGWTASEAGTEMTVDDVGTPNGYHYITKPITDGAGDFTARMTISATSSNGGGGKFFLTLFKNSVYPADETLCVAWGGFSDAWGDRGFCSAGYINAWSCDNPWNTGYTWGAGTTVTVTRVGMGANNITMTWDGTRDGVPYFRSITGSSTDAVTGIGLLFGDVAGWAYGAAVTDLVEWTGTGNPVPEPAGLGLVGMALLALRRRRRAL